MNIIMGMMKKVLVFIGLVIISLNSFAGQWIDTLYIPTGTDTIYTLDDGRWNFRGNGAIEFVYDSLDADDATLDMGPSLFESGDASAVGVTFNSYGDILGVSLPYTLDVTTNADSNTGVASLLVQFDDFYGNVLRIKVTAGSCTAGGQIYIKYRR